MSGQAGFGGPGGTDLRGEPCRFSGGRAAGMGACRTVPRTGRYAKQD